MGILVRKWHCDASYLTTIGLSSIVLISGATGASSKSGTFGARQEGGARTKIDENVPMSCISWNL